METEKLKFVGSLPKLYWNHWAHILGMPYNTTPLATSGNVLK